MTSTFRSSKWHLIHPMRKPLGVGSSNMAVAWCGVWFSPRSQGLAAVTCGACEKAIERVCKPNDFPRTLSLANALTIKERASTLPAVGREAPPTVIDLTDEWEGSYTVSRTFSVARKLPKKITEVRVEGK